MELILNEFERFLQSIIDNHTSAQKNDSVKGMRERVQELGKFKINYDNLVNERTDEILNNKNLNVDKEQLKIKLNQLANRKLNIFARTVTM